MKRCAHALALAIALTFGFGAPAHAQETPGRLRVFLDCSGGGRGGGGGGGGRGGGFGQGACDQREFRTEIEFVDWVLEPTAADVHVILTSQDAGGGDQHVIDLIGRNTLEAITDRLTITTADTDTRQEVLHGVTALLKAGLARYLAHHGRALDIEISPAEADERAPGQLLTRDPWNYWVFRIGADADAEGESRQTQSNVRASLSANRTTLDWRLDFELEGDFNRERFELNNGREFTNDTDDWELSGLVVRSIAGQWSTGGFFSAQTSTRLNQRLGTESAAAVEYSFFPYEQANRRALIAHYQLGVAHFRYDEMTIFSKTEETVGTQRFVLSYDTRQTWGDANVSLNYSSFLHDWGKHRLSGDAGISVRLFRGLELDLSGGYDRIRDQIYLPGGDLSNEEIIAERRELATGYEYEFRVGLSYRFGSVLNNFVNNRFPVMD